VLRRPCFLRDKSLAHVLESAVSGSLIKTARLATKREAAPGGIPLLGERAHRRYGRSLRRRSAPVEQPLPCREIVGIVAVHARVRVTQGEVEESCVRGRGWKHAVLAVGDDRDVAGRAEDLPDRGIRAGSDVVLLDGVAMNTDELDRTAAVDGGRARGLELAGLELGANLGGLDGRATGGRDLQVVRGRTGIRPVVRDDWRRGQASRPGFPLPFGHRHSLLGHPIPAEGFRPPHGRPTKHANNVPGPRRGYRVPHTRAATGVGAPCTPRTAVLIPDRSASYATRS
jgi:hypothetical protein